MCGWIRKSVKTLTLGIEHFRNTATIEDLLRMNGDQAFQALRTLVSELDEQGYHLFMLTLKSMIEQEQRCVDRSATQCRELERGRRPAAFGQQESARLVPVAGRSAARLLSLQAFYAYAAHFRKEQPPAAVPEKELRAWPGLPLNVA